MPDPKKVSIILLNLNGYEDTRDCLASLRKVRYSNFEVIVVDNGSKDDSAGRLQQEFPEIKVIRSQANLGFAEGNNIGIQEALGAGAAYVLLLNNDTIVAPSFLADLVNVGEADSGIGILGPMIFYEFEPDRIWYAGGYIKYQSGKCGHVGWDELNTCNNFVSIEDTAWVTGCALLIKSEVLQEVGAFDPKLFMYWEDTDLCMRARAAGYRCVFVPSAQVWHKVSRTSGLESSFTLYLGTRNQLAWVAKHIPFPYKPAALALTLMKKILKANFLLFKSLDASGAVWAGTCAFVLRKYGPPEKGMLVARRPLSVPNEYPRQDFLRSGRFSGHPPDFLRHRSTRESIN